MTEATTTNRPASTMPPAGKARADKEAPEPVPTPVSAPLAGIPEPPDEKAEKERELNGYKATAEHARDPFESEEDFETRQKKQQADFDKQQKDAEKETKKLMDARAKQEEAAAAKKK